MDVYVIHCEKHKERLPNIDYHLKKLFPQLKIWDGVVISNTVTDLKKEMNKYDTKIRVNNNNIFNKGINKAKPITSRKILRKVNIIIKNNENLLLSSK